MKRNTAIQEDGVDSKKGTPETKKSLKQLLQPGLFILGLIAIGLAAWLIFMPADSDKSNSTTTSYLTNSNGVACSVVEVELKCENLQTQVLQEFTIPRQYQLNSGISPSPDGKRLLITTYKGDVVVTDTSFNEVRKVFSASELKDRYPQYAWADGSKQLLVSEVAREEVDTNENPPPLVVRMLNLETGENPRVYKTGENVDVESIKVLGGNDIYIFIAYDTPKNWVADDVAPPPATINAIRLSDGLVLPVSSHQVSKGEIYYDAEKDTFISTEQNYNDPSKNHIRVARLEEGEFGLFLHKVFETFSSAINLGQPVLTAKGIQLANYNEQPQPFKLMQDNNTVTELKLVNSDIYNQILSLQAMPNLPQ